MMMEDDYFRTTLAYTKSPKTTRRTTFQDELEAAVSARANRQNPEETNYYSDDFEDDELFKELLKTRRKKMETFKAGKSKAKIDNVKLFDDDDEEENVKPKKVTFLKSRRRSPPAQETQNDSSSLVNTQSGKECRTEEKTPKNSQLESFGAGISQSESYFSRRSLSESPLPLNSENSHRELRLSPSENLENRGEEKEEEEEKPPVPQRREIKSSQRLTEAGSVEDKLPRPKPRPRALRNMADRGHDEGDGQAETSSSRAATSSVSIALSSTERPTSTSPERAGTSGSDGAWIAEEQHEVSEKSDAASGSLVAETSSRTPEGAQADDVSLSSHSREEKSWTSLEEHQETSVDTAQASADKLNQTYDVSRGTSSTSRPSSSVKSKSSRPCSAQSKYLGTLKVLDGTVDLQGDASDSLRATVYQDWLAKKQGKMQETLRERKQEEKLKEEKRLEMELSKKAEAKASYEAWKEKKHNTAREKMQKEKEAMRKQQEQMDERMEKKEMAKRMFEKWKLEQDNKLSKSLQKKVQEELRVKEKKVEEKERRKQDCDSSFSQWSEKKKDALQEKKRKERKEERIKEIEENYEKEEREKTALEMYEKWLKRKELQQKKEKREKKIRAIVQEELPPPWSPPSKTVPFGK